MDVVRYRVVVSGRVQGVGFRASCVDVARALGLAGSVRNSQDGNVIVDVEGSEQSVTKFLAWCRVGPQFAHVSTVDITVQEPTGETVFCVAV
jgi:acylphosphatase